MILGGMQIEGIEQAYERRDVYESSQKSNRVAIMENKEGQYSKLARLHLGSAPPVTDSPRGCEITHRGIRVFPLALL